MIEGYILGDKETVAKLQAMPQAIHDAVVHTVDALGVSLARIVVKDYLSGPRPTHLGRITGRLATSISRGSPDSTSRLEDHGTSVFAYVGTNVWYGKWWEEDAHDIVPVRAKALRFQVPPKSGNWVMCKIAHQSPRPFLKPALADLKPKIIPALQKAVTEAAVKVMK